MERQKLVCLLVGQSNMAGRGCLEAIDNGVHYKITDSCSYEIGRFHARRRHSINAIVNKAPEFIPFLAISEI